MGNDFNDLYESAAQAINNLKEPCGTAHVRDYISLIEKMLCAAQSNEAQVKQLAAANQQLRDENLKSTSALYDVVAENAVLKNALEWLYEAVSMPDSGPVPDKYYSAVTNAAAVMYEVTATESFLASLRAEGVDTYADFLAGLGWHEQDISNVRNFAVQLRSQSEQVKGVQS